MSLQNEIRKQCGVEPLNDEAAKYNWDSTGPGGCDSHCVEHPCGHCHNDNIRNKVIKGERLTPIKKQVTP